MQVEIVSITHPATKWPCLAGKITLGNRWYYFTPHFGGPHIFGPDTKVEELPGTCRMEQMDEDIVQNIIESADAEQRRREKVMPYLHDHTALFCSTRTA